ncbi:MAG: polysaccharide pyruvyl transferase family protein [Ruminococcaceae bacterium]|nr:polysaccharide pyruvyl transferase family protein [Oscillospiraceae bacterium]
MNILLDGYFDKNFGDDVMQQLVVKSFPEHTFFVNNAEREMLSHLSQFDNIRINCPCDNIDMYLNVIGTGFMFKGKIAKITGALSLLKRQKKYKKSAVVNCSFESFDSKAEEWLASKKIQAYRFITCRDKQSEKFLKKYAKSAEIKFYEDMVFSHDILPKPQLDEGHLGISAVRRAYSDTNYDYYKTLAEVADSYIEETGKKVLLFAFDTGCENDTSAVLSIRDMMRYPEMAELVLYDGNPDKFTDNMCRCSVFVGSRFHSIVTAQLLGIKSVAVHDRKKLKMLCADHNIPSVSKEALTCHTLTQLIKASQMPQNTERFKNSHEHIKALKNYIES